jgi:hypothetical protein
MRFGHTLSKLTLCVGLCSAVTGYGRGGETGTLDKEPDAPDAGTMIETSRGPGRSWSHYYLGYDHFRRLRARLSLQPLAPIPGWDKKRAWRYEDRYFSEDGDFEILPLMTEPIR